MSPEDRPMNRRRFFREGLRELLKPLAQTFEPIERAAHQLGKLDAVTAKPAPVSEKARDHTSHPEEWSAVLRPPGALAGEAFRSTCSRCGTCVNVCPVNAIKIDPTGERGLGAPYIHASTQACVACDGLYCMNACPTGALVPTPLNSINMGLAEWQEELCLRTHGQNCTVCVDHCPMGTAALDIAGSRIAVKDTGCIGCGTCQQVCPTNPKSILVRPASADLPAD